MENNMLSEMLASLNEVKLQLQTKLAQRPEYRALVILDKAAFQLADALDSLPPPVATPPKTVAREEASPTTLATKPISVVSGDEHLEDRLGEAPVETVVAVAEPVSAPPSSGNYEERAADAPVPAQAPTEETIKATSRAVDLFLSSSAQAAAPAAGGPRPRSYVPFVGAPRLVKSSRY